MDGHFVPNITIGPLVVASLRKALPNAVLDCHLMMKTPTTTSRFCGSRSELDLRAPGSLRASYRTLQLIDSHGCKSGVVLNPATPVHMLDEVLDMVHHVLIMS